MPQKNIKVDRAHKCANLKSVNIFLHKTDVLHDTERLLDHSRGPLSAEAALVAHVCITRGLMLRSKLNVDGINTTHFFWSASLELRDHVLSRRDSVEKFIVSSSGLTRCGPTRKLAHGIYLHDNRLFSHWYAFQHCSRELKSTQRNAY